jgi:hypothetical protein
MQQAYTHPRRIPIPVNTSLRPVYLPQHPEAAIDSRLIGAENFRRVFGGSHPCGGCLTCGGYIPATPIGYQQMSYLNPLPVRGGRRFRR